MNDFMEQTFYGNTILDYGIFVAILVIGFIAVRVVTSIVVGYIHRITERTDSRLDDMIVGIIRKNLVPLLYYGVFYIASRNLTLPSAVAKSIEVIGVILLTILAIRFLSSVFVYAMEHYWFKGAEEKDIRTFRGMVPAIKVVIWGLGLVFLLDNLGFEISTVLAGLGIGGIAVAMASQAVLGDLFSYFAIMTDRPFEVGDFIIVGDFLGSVEHVGIKTTRVRSLGGEQLVFSNTDLTSSRIKNYKRMEKRRILFRFGVIYQTTLEEVKEIPGLVKSIVERIPDTAFDRAHFASFGNFSLDFEVVYYVLSSDYNVYMNTQQEINFALKEELEKRGVEFAYPTQTVFVEGADKGSSVT